MADMGDHCCLRGGSLFLLGLGMKSTRNNDRAVSTTVKDCYPRHPAAAESLDLSQPPTLTVIRRLASRSVVLCCLFPLALCSPSKLSRKLLHSATATPAAEREVTAIRDRNLGPITGNCCDVGGPALCCGRRILCQPLVAFHGNRAECKSGAPSLLSLRYVGGTVGAVVADHNEHRIRGSCQRGRFFCEKGIDRNL